MGYLLSYSVVVSLSATTIVAILGSNIWLLAKMVCFDVPFNPVDAVILLFIGPESDYRKVLHGEGQEMLVLALSSLEASVAFLKDGSIEFQMLNLIREHSDRFLMLSAHISKHESQQALLKKLLDQRIAEQTAFLVERDKVSSFVRMCHPIKQGNRKNPYLFLAISDM